MVKKLHRSKTDKKIAGVCGGLEDYTGVDSTLWRLLFLFFALPGGIPGVILYLIMWIVVPEQPSTNDTET